jgi:hypothetical protein
MTDARTQPQGNDRLDQEKPGQVKPGQANSEVAEQISREGQTGVSAQLAGPGRKPLYGT